jgi:gamma-glutamyl hercynylcysteine S-oxide synthase
MGSGSPSSVLTRHASYTNSIEIRERMTGALTPTDAIAALTEARERTLALVADIGDEDLERVHSTLMSPLVWDLGHIAAFEDLWLVHRLGGEPMLRGDLAEVYDAFETPRAGRGELPFLRPTPAREYLDTVRQRAIVALKRHGVGDRLIPELIIRHEHQHNETMLQTLELARLRGFEPEPPVPAGWGGLADQHPTHTGLELVEVEGGEFTIGAGNDRFAYDNERPRHRAVVPDYRIGRTPITNGAWLTFVTGGGYERREWWSPEGWAWRRDHDITRPQGWTADLRSQWRLGRLVPLAADHPVVHISWFEADAFARAHAVRLPTEAEWERAATWDPGRGAALPYPWGEEPPVPGVHANVDQLSGGTAPAGRWSAGAAPSGCLGMLGDVWEWTSTRFRGYPGFVAYPYREYSEVFFGGDYRVLRGGSWATRARVVSPTFRNWDYPQRRQIFAGVRIAANA